MKIGVVIPAFNVEDFISEALDSVINQTVPFDEVIIVNDGSSDETAEIALSYVNVNPNWQLVNIENQGQGIARNIGRTILKTDYVYFFDADDVLAENFVESMVELTVNTKNPDLVLFSGKSFSASDYKKSMGAVYSRGFSCKAVDTNKAIQMLLKSGVFTASPCLYISKRVAWAQKNIAFGSYYYEDERVFLRLLMTASSVCVEDTPYFFRRLRPNSTMTSSINEKHVLGDFENLLSLSVAYKYRSLDSGMKKLLKNRARRYARRLIGNSYLLGNSGYYWFVLQISISIKMPILAIDAFLKLLLIKFNKQKQ